MTLLVIVEINSKFSITVSCVGILFALQSNIQVCVH